MNIHLCEKCAPTHLLCDTVQGIYRTIKCAQCQADIEPSQVRSYTLKTLLTACEEVVVLRNRNQELHTEVHRVRVELVKSGGTV